MEVRHFIQVWLVLYIHFISTSAEVCHCVPNNSAYHKVDGHDTCPALGDSHISPTIGCMPCSQRYLLKSFSENKDAMYNTELQVLMDQEFVLHDSCKRMLHNMSNVPVLSVLNRHLSGGGSHRRLISSMRFDIQLDDMSQRDAYSCKSVLIERLPLGVFADSFELQHLVHRGVLLDAAIFGDTNLELPSALSNQSILELHLDIEHGDLLELQGLQLTSELPLHARYPPLDAGGYSKVEIRPPNVVMLCKPKFLQPDCSSIIFNWDVRCEQKVVWEVPCGDQAHSRIVSSITFTSALLSALVIVYVAILHSLLNKNVKDS